MSDYNTAVIEILMQHMLDAVKEQDYAAAADFWMRAVNYRAMVLEQRLERCNVTQLRRIGAA